MVTPRFSSRGEGLSRPSPRYSPNFMPSLHPAGVGTSPWGQPGPQASDHHPDMGPSYPPALKPFCSEPGHLVHPRCVPVSSIIGSRVHTAATPHLTVCPINACPGILTGTPDIPKWGSVEVPISQMSKLRLSRKTKGPLAKKVNIHA